MEPYDTANRFKAGHRIRLDISSSNWPRFDVNPNSGGPLYTDDDYQVAENTVHHSATHPTHVELPSSRRTEERRKSGLYFFQNVSESCVPTMPGRSRP